MNKVIRTIAIAASISTALGLTACSPLGTQSGSSTSTSKPATVPTISQMEKGTTTAPPSSGPAAEHGKTVYYISCGQSAPGCADPAAGAAAAAKVLGWKLTIEDGQFDAGDAYNTTIRQALAAKPDAIIVEAIDCATVAPSLQEAKTAGIPVITTSSFDCDEGGSGPAQFAYKAIPNAIDRTQAAYFYRVGQYKAAYAIDKTHGKAKVLWLNATDAVPSNTAIRKGFSDTMKTCAACTVTNVNYSSTTLTSAAQTLTSALLQNPKANVLATDFDTPLEVGAGKALQESGARSHLLVMTGEGSGYGMDLIRGGQANAADAWDSAYLGWSTMDTVNRFFAGSKQVPEGQGIQLVQSASGVTAGQGWATSIDYKSVYTKIWKG